MLGKQTERLQIGGIYDIFPPRKLLQKLLQILPIPVGILLRQLVRMAVDVKQRILVTGQGQKCLNQLGKFGIGVMAGRLPDIPIFRQKEVVAVGCSTGVEKIGSLQKRQLTRGEMTAGVGKAFDFIAAGL